MKSVRLHFTKEVKSYLLLAKRPRSLETVPYPEALVQRDSSFFQPLCSRIPKEYTRYLVKPLDAMMDKGTKGARERFFKYAFVGMSGVAWLLDKG